jgi:hypothetical protein
MIEKKVFDTRIILLAIPTTTMNFGFETTTCCLPRQTKQRVPKEKGLCKIKSWQTSICPSG